MRWLALILLTGCASVPKQGRPTSVDLSCVTSQIEIYGDLCAESGTGYETMTGSEAHFEGVRCAVDAIKACLE